MADARHRSVPLGLPTLVGVGNLAGMLGVGGEFWQVAASGLLAALLVTTDLVRGWSAPTASTGTGIPS